MTVLISAVRETSSATRLVFANPNLRRVNLALVGSMIGDGAYATAIAVLAYTYGGAAAVGAYVAIRLALMSVTLPFLSALVDRLPRKAFMIGTDVIRIVLVASAASTLLLGGPVLLVLVLATATSVVGAPFRPAQASLLPLLSRTPHELTAANAVASTLESLSFFVGPAIGGLLLAVTDIPVILLLNAVSFGWSALMISRLRLADAEPVPEPVDATEEPGDAQALTVEAKTSLLTEALAGFRFIGSDRRLLLVMVLTGAQTVVAGASAVFTVVIALDLVRLGPPGVGYLEALLGVGAIAGGLVAISRSAKGTIARDFGAGVLGWAVPPLLVSAWPSPVAAFIAFAIIGMANPLVDVNLMTVIQRLTPSSVLGRVFGAMDSALIATMALGAFLMPLLISLVGIRWGLVVISVPILVLTLASLPALRRLDATVSPPAHLDLVTALPLFQPLAPAVQEDVARRLTRMVVPAGAHVITAGERGDRFYLVESGRLDAVRGPELLSEMRAGDCFGEIALLRDVPRTATVVAERDSVIFALDRDDFLAAVGAESEAANRAELLVSRRIVR